MIRWRQFHIEQTLKLLVVLMLLLVGLALFSTRPTEASVEKADSLVPYLAPLQQISAWSALANNGLNGEVATLAVVGNDLFVGGRFSGTNDGTVTNLGNIARYNMSTNDWSALANNGLNNDVFEITVVGSELYVGGLFTQTNDGSMTNLGSIARYDLSTNTWSPLANNGLNDWVTSIVLMGSDLYVGGTFTQTVMGGVTLNRIARYNMSTDTWSTLANNGLDAYVSEIRVVGSDLYMVGIFDQTVSGGISLNRIARYNTSTDTWSALANDGLNSSTFCLVVVGSDMYVGGAFSGTADGALIYHRIARYDLNTDTWSALPNIGLNNPVHTLAATGDDLFVGGSFSQTFDGAVTLNRIARYNMSDTTWNPLSNNGLTGGSLFFRVWDLTVVGSDLYVGGDFTQTADGAMVLNFIARYNLRAAEPTTLPETGFKPGVISSLPTQPEEKAFATYGDIWLEIPKLNLELPIVGVPLVRGEWDVNWLGNQVGYLEGTAFPTWSGNTGLTAHVWDMNNNPGPFAHIKDLCFGDEVRIHAWDQVYIYSIRSSYLASPNNLSAFRHEEYDWVTLVTCESYNQDTDMYGFRRIVRAVLVGVNSEKANAPSRRWR